VICLEHVAVEVRCSGERGRCRRLIAIAYEIPVIHREGLGGVLLVVPACDSPTMYHVVPADFAGYVYDCGPLACPRHSGARWPPGPGWSGVLLPPRCADLREPYRRFLASGRAAELRWPYRDDAVLT
jgi:hypothetical protein